MGDIQIKDGFRGERSLVMPNALRQLAEEDPVLSTLHITDLGFYPNAVYHHRRHTTGIDQFVLIYCTKGSGRYQVGDKHYEVKSNQYFILPANTPHAYASNNVDPWTIYWIHFRGTLAPYYAQSAMAPITISTKVNSRIADRNSIFEDMFLTLTDGYSIDNLRYASSLLHFYLGSLQYLPIYRKCHKKIAPSDNGEDNIITNATLKYMEENLGKSISLHDLSVYTGYSIPYLSMVFKNNTGHSPLTYFNMLKIKKACQLLETTNMKINQICCIVGISNSFYFSRLFTKIVGVSPKKYREEQ